MANQERGEVDIQLDGKSYPLRPSMEAILEIEKTVGTLRSLIHRHNDPAKGLSYAEQSKIIAVGIRAAGKDRGDDMLMGVSESRVAELIFGSGMINLVEPLMEFLLNAAGGGGTEKKGGAAPPPNR